MADENLIISASVSVCFIVPGKNPYKASGSYVSIKINFDLRWKKEKKKKKAKKL